MVLIYFIQGAFDHEVLYAASDSIYCMYNVKNQNMRNISLKCQRKSHVAEQVAVGWMRKVLEWTQNVMLYLPPRWTDDLVREAGQLQPKKLEIYRGEGRPLSSSGHSTISKLDIYGCVMYIKTNLEKMINMIL